MSISPLATAAVSAVSTGLTNAARAREAQRSFDRQKKLLREEYRINQEAQRNAAANNVFGLKRAGLNPALANGANFAPAGASVPSAPMADFDSPVSSALQAAQVQNQVNAQEKANENLDADIAVKRETERKIANEADIAELTANRMRDADSGVNENMLQHLKSIRAVLAHNSEDTSTVDNIIKEIEDGKRSYTLGSLEMNELFERYRRSHASNIPVYSENDSNLKIAELRRKSPTYSKLVAALPEKEASKVDAEIAKIYRDAYNAQVSGHLNEKKIQEIDANIKKTIEEAKAIAQRSRSEYLRDPRMLIADEDYAKLATYIGMDVYEKGTGVLQALVTKSLPAPEQPDKVEEIRQEVLAPNSSIPVQLKTVKHQSYHQPQKKKRR